MLPKKGDRVRTNVNLPMVGEEENRALLDLVDASDEYKHPIVRKGSTGIVVETYNKEDEEFGQAVLTVNWDVDGKTVREDIFNSFVDVL